MAFDPDAYLSEDTNTGFDPDAYLSTEQATEETTAEGPGGGMSFFNKALAQTFGAPVDLISAGLEKVGVQAPGGGAFGGSESIRRGLANIGAPTPDRDPEGYLENIGQVGGEVASMMIPIAKGAQVLSKGTGTAARVAQAMNKPMTSIPGALGAAGVEGGGVVGAGIARDVAKEQEVGSGGWVIEFELVTDSFLLDDFGV